MPFEFDDFINKPCMAIFGRGTIYRPKNPRFEPFEIPGDFHHDHANIDLQTAGAEISSTETVLFVRLIDFPTQYPKPLQGDYVTVFDTEYQIIDIRHHIPGSRKLILHET